MRCVIGIHDRQTEWGRDKEKGRTTDNKAASDSIGINCRFAVLDNQIISIPHGSSSDPMRHPPLPLMRKHPPGQMVLNFNLFEDFTMKIYFQFGQID